jgi:hypothetical protein
MWHLLRTKIASTSRCQPCTCSPQRGTRRQAAVALHECCRSYAQHTDGVSPRATLWSDLQPTLSGQGTCHQQQQHECRCCRSFLNHSRWGRTSLGTKVWGCAVLQVARTARDLPCHFGLLMRILRLCIITNRLAPARNRRDAACREQGKSRQERHAFRT